MRIIRIFCAWSAAVRSFRLLTSPARVREGARTRQLIEETASEHQESISRG